LVISITDGVTSYTRTLWHLLKRYQVPVFIFVNKVDAIGADRGMALVDIQKNLSESCVDFSKIDDEFYENVAATGDA
ncbi:GTP-binding protein, partial [Staphylococcus lugdunensis]